MASLLLSLAPRASAQSNPPYVLPACQVNATCNTFVTPGLNVGAAGITFANGSVQTAAAGGSATPSGPAGGSLAGTYPNPSLATQTSPLLFTGANGYLQSQSSITASAFFGNGAGLTNVPATFLGGSVPNQTTFQSSVTVNGAGGLLVQGGSVTASAFFGSGASLTALSFSTSVVTVGPSPNSGAQFTSVAAAVAALGTPSIQTDVLIMPGLYNEQPFSLPSNVALWGPYAGRATLNFVSAGSAITIAGTTGNNISSLLITNTGGGPAIEITGQSGTGETVLFSQITGHPALLLDVNARPINSQTTVWTANGSSAAVVIGGTFGTGAAAAQNLFDNGSQIVAVAGQDAILISTPVVLAIRNTSVNVTTVGKYSINATVPVAVRYGQMTVVGGGCPAQNNCVSTNTTFGTSAAPYNFNPGVNSISGIAISPSPIDGQFLVGASSTSAKWTSGNGLSSLAPGNSLFVDSSGNVVLGQGGTVSINMAGQNSTTTINGIIQLGSAMSVNSNGLGAGPAGSTVHIGGNSYFDNFGNMTLTGSTITLSALNGTGGFLTAQSSVTASSFFGDGSHLTGIPSTSSISGVYLPLAGGTMTGGLNLTNVPVTLTGASGNVVSAASVTASGLFGKSGSVTNAMTAGSFAGDGSALTYSGSQVNAIPFVTTAGSTLSFNASFLSWDNVNHRLGIRTANPAHGLDCSSCTLYLDGNASNPILVGNNGSTMTLTSGGNLTISGAMSAATSSVTASAFFGDPSHMASGYVIVVSSYAASTSTIASTNFVGIATATVTNLRGGRPLLVNASTNLNNLAAGGRTYTCQLLKDGVAVDTARELDMAATSFGIMSIPHFESSSPSGSHTFGIVCKTSSASSTQNAGNTYIVVQEF